MTEAQDGIKGVRWSHGSTFAIIPEWILDAPISDRAVRLFAILARHADHSGRSVPGRKRLAERLGCALSTLDVAMQQLVDVGAITVTSRVRDDGSLGTNDYLLHAVPGRGGSTEHQGEGSTEQPVEKELEPYRTRDVSTPSGVLTTLTSENGPPAMTMIAGRNLPLDALVEVTDIDPKSPRVTQAAVALNGKGRQDGIRKLFWVELERASPSEAAALLLAPEEFERLLAIRVRQKAEKYRLKMPPDTLITPTALARYWLDLEVMDNRGGGLSPEEMRSLA